MNLVLSYDFHRNCWPVVRRENRFLHKLWYELITSWGKAVHERVETKNGTDERERRMWKRPISQLFWNNICMIPTQSEVCGPDLLTRDAWTTRRQDKIRRRRSVLYLEVTYIFHQECLFHRVLSREIEISDINNPCSVSY